MKFLIVIIITCFIGLISCDNSSKVAKVFCDTTCLQDTIKFTGDHAEKPFVYISVNDCMPDTVIWSHNKLASNLKIDFNEVAGSGLRINKDKIACYFKDTSYAWLEFNDCLTGRGFLAKLNYTKKSNRSKYTSALTHFDPKYKIEDGLICYADYTFIYVEDIYTGKTEKMLLADHEVKINYDQIHNTFDSVNISRNRIFIELIENGQKKPLEKKISL